MIFETALRNVSTKPLFLSLQEFVTSKPGGVLVQRSIRDVPLKWVSKSASWYNYDPLFSAKTGINMGHIFKILINWCENKPNFINLIPKFLKFA